MRKQMKPPPKKEKKGPSMAATTPLVRSMFDSMFQTEIDEKESLRKRTRCGICDVSVNTLYS